jgi:hypothetical protein
MMGTEDVMWTCKFRNGTIKRFKFPIRTTAEGSANAYDDLKGQDMDEDLINYMRHFFSDYQDLFRSFSDVNHHAKALMQIDGIRHPKKFNERADQLLAGRNPFNDNSVFNQLRSNLQADEQQKSD